MAKIQGKSNFESAKKVADAIDEEIIKTLESGKSFKVESGAGSGKTYSLNRVIQWLQENRDKEFKKKAKKIACITYTNAAVNVINERLQNDSSITPSTIHSFAWNSIKQYQDVLISMIKKNKSLHYIGEVVNNIKKVSYTLGNRNFEEGIHYLYHEDVLILFCKLLDNEKFRLIFSGMYPIILIDEYQDTYAPIIKQFIKYFISKNIGPQFCFFGDSWQTIYQSNNAIGNIEHKNIKIINKTSNFRSAPKIVEFLNKIRTELKQQSAIDGFEGEIIIINCNDYTRDRFSNYIFCDDLPENVFRDRTNNILDKIKKNIPKEESTKELMITHKLIARQNGYSKLLDILNETLKNKSDPFLLFFIDIVETIYHALKQSNTQLLFDALGIERYPITKKEDKTKWKDFLNNLEKARKERTIDVFNLIKNSNLIPIPPILNEWYQCYITTPNKKYIKLTTIEEFLNIKYSQFVATKNILCPDSLFSTEHGVKGEEYDNIIFVISNGWLSYKFEKYIPMLGKNISNSTEKIDFERNRNLFYVCCSRAKKRLILFITIPFNGEFQNIMTKFVGKQNIYTYKEFMCSKNSI